MTLHLGAALPPGDGRFRSGAMNFAHQVVGVVGRQWLVFALELHQQGTHCNERKRKCHEMMFFVVRLRGKKIPQMMLTHFDKSQ